MNQQDILNQIVAEFHKDPGNQIIIGMTELTEFASEEIGKEVTPEDLCEALQAHHNEQAGEEHLNIVDAASALCNQVADRCWGECLDEDYDEWDEVDISIDWEDVDLNTSDNLYATIRPC
ncbi:hypothetical protein C1752_14874 [Acaryochloris thomasi RCC1774]|uniref:Uncharacterized protein n=1 Tax=Acaryochloris thomasi RCC1774 TaxID=1764569 RepID=A0A2W1JLV0_9CYAN|nr:hypothetical protein [Acaryochloris thomasi]PZD70261.1 hypothetical protein C1752_14874 [Acaryochloris thomasi RCC1774]